MKKTKKIVLAFTALALMLGLAAVIKAATMVNLGTANSFAVLAGSAITETGNTVITGDVGLSPAYGSSYTGLTGVDVTGTIYAVDATGPAGSISNPSLLTTAQNDLTAAYVAAASSTSTLIGSELGGQVLTPDAYYSADGKFGITGTTTLDAQNDPSAVFIFQTASTLTTAASSTVNLINGANPCNVFWQVGSSATLGTNSVFKGNILALSSITLTTGAVVTGRVLARNGAVTLDSNTISGCSTGLPIPQASGVSGTINVVKRVINDNGRTKTIADFPLFVSGMSVISGVTNTFRAPAGVYVVTETQDPNYTQSFSGDCDAQGYVNLIPGENKFCIVTNNDTGAPIITPPVPPLIDVVKVPNPLALPAGPGLVQYTYTLTNIGTVPVTDISMVGDTCSPIKLISGDTNNNAKLEVNETWKYTCSTTLSETHTNTVVTTGWANGLSATDITSATVVVGQPIVPPLIHLTKVPNPLTLLAGGGMVTYTKKVTNPGTVALSNVRVADDKCAPITYISGDTNNDSKLDPTETWTYNCRTRINETTTNTAVASGEANGLVARDFAIATVVVASAVPALPNTGFAPTTKNILWSFILLAGILAIASASLVIALKKNK